ncbi:Binding-protein-dependent transport systems inner membrane component [Thermotoga neapolitana LA10]|uniref:Binding-protein-dependent transport systems inner membrane component n=2 Tax=Thermotogaceae TaxID=188709 RepID=B9KAF9_THENN|nr:Binding-protein-dependent transport systems inner membrane component [Thermotoga neapolitana DSM 4359]KFZ20987.1 Binding-protein-dependent transport systems inner membrane component [Thermotoga neapolitana LA10]
MGRGKSPSPYLERREKMSRRKYHLSLRKRQLTLAFFFITIPTFLMILFIYYPLIFGVKISFYQYDMVGESIFIGLRNYIELLKDPLFWNAFKNSLLYLLVVPPLQIISMLLAVLVDKAIKGRNLFRTLIFLPVVTPITIAAITWQWMYREKGFINFLLRSLHITDKSISFLSDPNIALFAIMFVTMWKGFGYYMVIYLAGLQSIPRELLEAAKVDGARPSQVFFKVTMPLLKPYILFCSTMSSIAALNVFGEIYAMTKGGPAHATETMGLFIYNKAFGYLQFGYSNAAAILFSFVVIAFSLLNFYIFREGGLKSYYA